MEKEFFYEIKNGHILCYRRNMAGVLQIYGRSPFKGDPNDLPSIKKCIDDFLKSGNEFVEPIFNYVCHRISINDKSKIKSK